MRPSSDTANSFEVSPSEIRQAELGFRVTGNMDMLERITSGTQLTTEDDYLVVDRRTATTILAGNISLLSSMGGILHCKGIATLETGAFNAVDSAVDCLFTQDR